MKEECVFCKRAKEAIVSNIDYTGIIDKKDLEHIFYDCCKLPKTEWFFAIRQLERERFLVQVSRGRGGIKYVLNVKSKQ